MNSRRPPRPRVDPVWAGHWTQSRVDSPGSPRTHDTTAFVYQVSGTARFEFQGDHEVGAGDVLLVPAGEPHRVLSAEDRVSWGVGFCAPCFAPTELVELFDPFERARAGASPVVTLPPAVRARFEANCKLLAEETQGHAALHKPMVVKSLLAILLAEVSRAHAVSASAGLQPTLVGDALRFIERNCLRPLSLREVAAELNRSTSHVASAVKRATGKTVGEWILVGRLSEARNRLLHSDEIVEVIAERVGYADCTHFIRLFRRVHGVTPAAWREERQHSEGVV